MGSNAGIVGMTKEHLGLALALNVPVFVVVTKIDMCPANILQGAHTHTARGLWGASVLSCQSFLKRVKRGRGNMEASMPLGTFAAR